MIQIIIWSIIAILAMMVSGITWVSSFTNEKRAS